jgi:hypothetical protein
MSQELFLSVQQAEEAADRAMQDAQQKARELIKDTEAQIKAEERKASLSNRAQYQSILEKKRVAVLKSIGEKRPKVMKAQQESLNAARLRLEAVSRMIFERIWNDGDR